jgi:hypothetical protein
MHRLNRQRLLGAVDPVALGRQQALNGATSIKIDKDRHADGPLALTAFAQRSAWSPRVASRSSLRRRVATVTSRSLKRGRSRREVDCASGQP